MAIRKVIIFITFISLQFLIPFNLLVMIGLKMDLE